MPADPVRGRRWADHRRTLEAIAWKYRTCSPWRDLLFWLRPTPVTTSAGPCQWTPPSVAPTSTPPAPGKRGARPGRARRPRAGTRRSRGGLSTKGPHRRRQPGTAPGPPRHHRPGRRRTSLRSCHGRRPCSAKRTRKTENPAGDRPGRSGVLVPRDPEPSPPTRYPRSPSPAVRPGRPSPTAGPRRRPTARLRRGGVHAAQRGRTMHQPDQAMARPGPANRQARHCLPGRTPPRRHPHLDPTLSGEEPNRRCWAASW